MLSVAVCVNNLSLRALESVFPDDLQSVLREIMCLHTRVVLKKSKLEMLRFKRLFRYIG